jgi:hypothetical protein
LLTTASSDLETALAKFYGTEASADWAAVETRQSSQAMHTAIVENNRRRVTTTTDALRAAESGWKTATHKVHVPDDRNWDGPDYQAHKRFVSNAGSALASAQLLLEGHS